MIVRAAYAENIAQLAETALRYLLCRNGAYTIYHPRFEFLRIVLFITDFLSTAKFGKIHMAQVKTVATVVVRPLHQAMKWNFRLFMK